MRAVPAGESGLYLVVGESIDPEINSAVLGLSRAIAALQLEGLRDLVPGYGSLFVEFDPLLWSAEELEARLSSLDSIAISPAEARLITIPVHYGGSGGPDLEQVASLTGLSAEEVIQRHSQAEYRVYFLGFTPGFPFLGGMDKSLAVPRLATPRTLVPAGSVGIAGAQTGVYPVASPGGWRVIGRTELPLFDPLAAEPVLLRPGDLVRFVPAPASSIAGGAAESGSVPGP